MSPPPAVEALAEVWTALAELGGGLGEEEWSRPTACPGWSVRDVFSHVVGTESALAGRPSPPTPPVAAAHVQNPIGELNEAWVSQRRSWPGRRVLAEFVEVTGERLGTLRAMTDEDFATPGPSPIGMVPYAVFMDVRVLDCWVHDGDVRTAVGRPLRLEGPAAEIGLSRLLSSFGYVVGKKAAPAEGATVSLVLSGPLGRTVSVAISKGRAVGVDPPEEPTATIGVDTATYVVLATGRRPGSEVLAAGLAALGGDRAIGEAVVANLAQMP